MTGNKIESGSTLLFFDEIQVCPKAITALRYFFEDIPDLHVIGAGSLLDFVLEEISFPVGRIEFVYFRPFTFREYLAARGLQNLSDMIGNIEFVNQPSAVVHDTLLKELKTFCFYGGMPGVLKQLVEEKDPLAAINEQENIVSSYRADFAKYRSRLDPDVISRTFDMLPRFVGRKTTYSKIDPEAYSYQIKKSVDLLEKAHVIHKVRSADVGFPLSAGASEKHYKTIFLDVGLLQRLSGFRFEDWLLQPSLIAAYEGAIAEQFVGQELLNIESGLRDPGLFFWERNKPSSSAELDYLTAIAGRIVPIEVKSGTGGKLKSMKLFLDEFKSSTPGIKLSEDGLGKSEFIQKIPLYAVSEIERINRFSSIY
jgi:predicted AAA+ superfamily ATPase